MVLYRNFEQPFAPWGRKAPTPFGDPADSFQLLSLDRLTEELKSLATEKNIQLVSGEHLIDDVLTYALFPQIGLQFLENRGNPDAFEPVPTGEAAAGVPGTAVPVAAPGAAEVYTVTVSGQSYVVQVAEGGDVTNVAPAQTGAPAFAGVTASAGEPIPAPLAGNIFKVCVNVGDKVQDGDVIVILEAMKMETEVRSPKDGHVGSVSVAEGDKVVVGDTLLTLS